MFIGVVSFVGACMLAPSVAAAQPNLVTNGSFEDPVIGGPLVRYFAPSNAIAGWSISEGSMDLCSFRLWQVIDGSNNLDLDGGSGLGGRISTTFPTTPGACYLVRFALAGNVADLPIIKTMEVGAAGQFATFTFDTTGLSFENMGWREEYWSFVASEPTTTLYFQSRTSPVGYGAVIDDVRVTPGRAADFNHDGVVNSTDVSDFINAWFQDQVKGTLITDWDGNGVVNSTDVSEFINQWFEDTATECE